MGLPITILIDDPAPLINVYWWHAHEREPAGPPTQDSGEPVERLIPTDFLRQFVDVIERRGVRGKFSVLPYPAGLGPIDEGWPGCDRGALEEWLDLVRQRVTPLMDITPEILTHARAVDLETMTLLDENERDWSRRQTADALTPYIAHALQILGRVGLSAAGVTSPWNFGSEVEDHYREAICRAMRAMGRGQTWYFLHADDEGTRFRSQVVRRDGEGWLVSLWSQVDDYLWATMETSAAGPEYVGHVADSYLTADGRGGRLAQLFAAGTPMVMCTHWQSLYSNGRRTGLRILDEVCRRARGLWDDQVTWTSCSDLARGIADGTCGPSAGGP
ncbi:hypothetical protein ACFL6X_04050 [Candidatus Latescibacterota bacterium]